MANKQRSRTVSNVRTLETFLIVTENNEKLFQEIGYPLKLFITVFMHYVSNIDSCPYNFNLFFVYHPTYT